MDYALLAIRGFLEKHVYAQFARCGGDQRPHKRNFRI